MARRTLNERHIRKLSKGGSSYYITLPIDAVRALNWKKGQKLIVGADKQRKRLIVKDWPA